MVTLDTARQLAASFVSRFDEAVRRLQRVRSPVDGRWVRVPDWTVVHREEPGLLPPLGRAAVIGYGEPSPLSPPNLTSLYHVDAKPGRGGSFALGALCFCPTESDHQGSIRIRPVTSKELNPILERAADAGRSSGALYVLAIASPTGFDPAALEVVTGAQATRGFHSTHLAPCLVDLSSNSLAYNLADGRIAPLQDLFAGELPEETVQRVAQQVRQALLTRQSQSVAEVAAATRAPLPAVQQAFAQLEAEGPYVVQRLKGLGQVISRRL